MGVKDLFSRSQGGKISEKRMGYNKYQKSAVFQKIISNPEIAKKLDRPIEKHEFYEMMKGKGEGGLTKREMKEVFGELMTGKGRTINRGEAYALAKEFFGDEKIRYIMPKNKSGSQNVSGRGAESKIRTMSNKGIQPNISRSVPAGLRASVYRTSSIGEDAKENKKDSFFQAMRTTIKNNPSQN